MLVVVVRLRGDLLSETTAFSFVYSRVRKKDQQTFDVDQVIFSSKRYREEEGDPSI